MAALAAADALVERRAQETVPDADERRERALSAPAPERPDVHPPAALDGSEEVALARPQREAEDLLVVARLEEGEAVAVLAHPLASAACGALSRGFWIT